jgi:hypothetical protein
MKRVIPEPFMKLRTFIKKHGLPIKSTYDWKREKLFPFYQIKNIILVREGEVLSALEAFRQTGNTLLPTVLGRKSKPGPGRPKGSRNKAVKTEGILDVKS